MLILIGVVPTAFALNRTPDVNYLDAYKAAATQAGAVLQKYEKPGIVVTDARAVVSEAVPNKTVMRQPCAPAVHGRHQCGHFALRLGRQRADPLGQQHPQ